MEDKLYEKANKKQSPSDCHNYLTLDVKKMKNLLKKLKQIQTPADIRIVMNITLCSAGTS